ncbi:MAG: TonB family protein [Gammaproteobacteria bacterium]|nr:TonB family protein [Gammaproteobacteria bacterium]
MGISTQKDSSILVALIVAALLAITGGAWLVLNDNDEVDVAHDLMVQPQIDEHSIQRPAEDHSVAVDKAIQMAELAFQAGQLAEPAEGSAVHFYREVLSLEPSNPRAMTGMKLVASQLTDEAMEQIQKRNYEQAIATLNLLSDIEPESDNVIAVRLSLVEKTRIMYAAMDEAISQRQFERAETLARRLRGFPEVDAARVSAALVAIATARNQPEVVQEVIGDYVEPEMRASSTAVPPAATETTVPMHEQTDNTAVAEPMEAAANVRADESGSATRQMKRAEPGTNPGVDAMVSVDSQRESTGVGVTGDTALMGDAALEVGEDAPAMELADRAGTSDGQAVPNELVSPETVALAESRVAQMLAIATERVAELKLMHPESDSAYHYYQQALILDPGNTEAKRGLRSLVQTLTANALHQGETGKWQEAEALLTEADRIAYAESLVTETRSEIKTMRLAAEQDKFVNISQFLVKKSVTPKYPRRAVSRSVEGWVTLEFVVDANGETRDIKVVDSSRQYASQFSKAAIQAVEQWQFKPRMFEGQAISQRSKTTVQFKLTD